MKTCTVENCVQPVWGKGFCKRHQSLRQDKKAKKIPVRTQRTHVREFSFGFDDQLSLFEYLWEGARNKQGRVICQYTGEDITELEFGTVEAWVCCFAHILNKKNWTYFRLNPDNVRVVFPIFHTIIDQGTYDQRKQHPEWKFGEWDAEVIRLKEAYQQYKKENLLA